MPIAKHSSKFPSIRCLFPDIGKPRSSVELLGAIGVLLVEAVSSELYGPVAGNREDPDDLLIERPVIFRLLSASRFEGFNVPVMTLEARGVVEKLKIRTEAATKLGDVAGVVAGEA